MEKYVPDIYKQSIYEIDYSKLMERGIKYLLFDLDNTIVPAHYDVPSEKVKHLFQNLENLGFKVIIFSNSPKKRVKKFKDMLEVDCCAKARKPFSKRFFDVIKAYHCVQSEMAIIGDQILTDILGGNKVGITTILVHPISTRDIWVTKINRHFEKRIIQKLTKRNLFLKGKYYE